jgi:hypothetical protein
MGVFKTTKYMDVGTFEAYTRFSIPTINHL